VAAIRARGIDVLLGTFHTPQSDFEFSMRSLRLFLTEVIPAVERTPTPAATNAGGVPASA
jgi:hypothetical protein